MAYLVNGETLEVDDEGYLLEANFSDDVCPVIAEAEGITLTADHWSVIGYLRDQYREHGHTPNYRNMLKDLSEQLSGRGRSCQAGCACCRIAQAVRQGRLLIPR
jgi:tRNA 2-thiouridine synthesizing protein E